MLANYSNFKSLQAIIEIKKDATPRGRRFWLSHQDSNLGKQNQNLMCYHYTMGQFL